jgi:hypothetical protein
MEIPLLFSTPMVKAIFKNIKSMTRRTRGLDEINKNPDKWIFVDIIHSFLPNERMIAIFSNKETGETKYIKCPYGIPGATIWVRETWCRGKARNGDDKTIYKADIETDLQPIHDWKPSIHMPRKAARLFLTVKNIMVERLHDISEEDALKEGVRPGDKHGGEKSTPAGTARQSFMWLWQRLNDKRGYGWAMNHYVWVVEFEKQQGGISK